MEHPSNADLMRRINALETKVDHISNLVQQANGAVSLLRWIGGFVLGIAALWTAMRDWWR